MNKQITREDLVELVESILSDTLLCDRVWEAWGVGTMSENDFCDSTEDEGFVDDKVDAIKEFLSNRGIDVKDEEN